MKDLYITTYCFAGTKLSPAEQIQTAIELGFQGVEPIMGLDEEAAALVSKYGLKISDIGQGVKLDGTIDNLEMIERFGVKYIGGGPMYYDHETALRCAEKMNADGKIAKKYGLKVYVHNHTQEFTFDDVEGGYCWETVAKNIDPETCCFQLDAGWAQIAGADPVYLIKKYPKLIGLMHVKPCTAYDGINSVDYKEMMLVQTQGRDSLEKFDIEAFSRKQARMQGPMADCLRPWKEILETAEAAGCSAFIVERDYFYTDRIETLKADLKTLREVW